MCAPAQPLFARLDVDDDEPPTEPSTQDGASSPARDGKGKGRDRAGKGGVFNFRVNVDFICRFCFATFIDAVTAGAPVPCLPVPTAPSAPCVLLGGTPDAP